MTVERLEALQHTVAQADAALRERNELAFDMWQEGYTQREIAETIDRADRQAGGPGVTHDSIAKTLYRMRLEREEQLISSALR